MTDRYTTGIAFPKDAGTVAGGLPWENCVVIELSWQNGGNLGTGDQRTLRERDLVVRGCRM